MSGAFVDPKEVKGERGTLEGDVRVVLRELLESQDLCDLRLHGFTDESGLGTLQQVHVHKVVLAIRSPVFRKLLSVGGDWFGRSEAMCGGLVSDYGVFSIVIHFMYTDEFAFAPMKIDLIARVHHTSHIFQVSRLEKLASAALQEKLESKRQSWMKRRDQDNLNDKDVVKMLAQWFKEVLAVLQFAMRSTQTEGCADADLAKACLELIKGAVEKDLLAKHGLFRAIHDPVDTYVADGHDGSADLCSPSICSEVILAICSTRDHAMSFAVFCGRADIVVDLLARGIDPDSPSPSGALPVELALQLGQQKRSLSMRKESSMTGLYSQSISLRGDMFKPNQEEFENEDMMQSDQQDAQSDEDVGDQGNKMAGEPNEAEVLADWVSKAEMDSIVETLIMGGSREMRGRLQLGRKASDMSLNESHHNLRQQPMLNLAAKIGNARHVKALLAAGLNVNEQDSETGRSALHCAAEAGWENVVRVLLDAGAVYNQQDVNGCTALHLACRRGHLSIVELLQPLVNENIPDRFGWTSLHHAARKGHAEVTRQLLQQSKRPMQFLLANEYEQGSTAVHLAACNAHYKVILVMLDCARELDHQAFRDSASSEKSNLMHTVNCKDLTGRAPLHRAAGMACEIILKDMQDRSDILTRAFKVIEALIDAGADILAPSKLGYVPLHFALGGQASHSLSQQGELKPRNNNSGGFGVTKGLLGEGGPQEKRRNRSMAQLLSILLGAPGGSAAIQAVGKDGVTPLHCAVRSGFITVVPTLVTRGADINARDAFHQSPLSIAREHWPLPLLANAMLKVLPAPPSWVEDAQETRCQSCGVQFSMTTRRHHCRHCSCLVCSSCTQHRMAIPKYGIEKPVRVCNGCHEALSWPSPLEDEIESDEDFESIEDSPSYQENLLGQAQDSAEWSNTFPPPQMQVAVERFEPKPLAANTTSNAHAQAFTANNFSSPREAGSVKSAALSSGSARQEPRVTHMTDSPALSDKSSKKHIKVRPRKNVRQVTLS